MPTTYDLRPRATENMHSPQGWVLQINGKGQETFNRKRTGVKKAKKLAKKNAPAKVIIRKRDDSIQEEVEMSGRSAKKGGKRLRNRGKEATGSSSSGKSYIGRKKDEWF